MATTLVPYELSGQKLKLLQECFSQLTARAQPEQGLPTLYKKRPRPSELRQEITVNLSGKEMTSDDPPQLVRNPPEVMNTVLRSVQRTWENFYEGSVGPSEFMRTPFGASYKLVTIEGKGRGIIASRDIPAGEVVLEDTPVIVLPPPPSLMSLVLTLPQKALEAVLLLHNTKPEFKQFSAVRDVPVNRLVDMLQGIMDTNSFQRQAACGRISILLLPGSMFNHSDRPNLAGRWEDATEKMVFTATQDIKKGDELEIDYLPGYSGAHRAIRLRGYSF